MKIFELSLFGFWLPFIGRRRLPINWDGSFVTDEDGVDADREGFLYMEPLAFEWLNYGFALCRQTAVRRTDTGEIDHMVKFW